jgi:hypothetical protein
VTRRGKKLFFVERRGSVAVVFIGSGSFPEGNIGL